jgi:hypothetical protein
LYLVGHLYYSHKPRRCLLRGTELVFSYVLIISVEGQVKCVWCKMCLSHFLRNPFTEPTFCYSCVLRDLNHFVPQIGRTCDTIHNSIRIYTYIQFAYTHIFNSHIHIYSPTCIFVPNLYTSHRKSCCCLHLTAPVKQIYLLSCVLSSTEKNSFDFHGIGRNV